MLVQSDPEAAACRLEALHANTTVHRLHEVFDDGQSDTRSAHVSGSTTVDAIETLKDAVTMGRIDARSVIVYDDAYVLAF